MSTKRSVAISSMASRKIETGQHEPGHEALGRCLELLEQENDELGKILVLMAMAEAESYFQSPEKAMDLYQQAVDLTERLANSNLPLRLESFRLFARLTGQPDAIFGQAESMMQLMRPLFVNLVEVLVRDRFGIMLLDSGQIEAARLQLERAAELSARLFGLNDAQIFDHLAQLHQREGDFDHAAQLFDKALAAARRMGDLRKQFVVLDRKAELDLERGRFGDSIVVYGKALEVARQARHLGKEAELLIAKADLHEYMGNIEIARRQIQEALRIAKRSGDSWVLAQAQMSFAALSFWTGYYEVVIETLEGTLDLLDTLGTDKPEVAMVKISALNFLSQAYLLLGREEQVEPRAREALALSTRFDSSEGMALSQAMLDWPSDNYSGSFGALMNGLSSALGTSSITSLRYFGRQAAGAFPGRGYRDLTAYRRCRASPGMWRLKLWNAMGANPGVDSPGSSNREMLEFEVHCPASVSPLGSVRL